MSTLAAVTIGVCACVLVAPYSAQLTLSAPDDDDKRWWRGRPAGTRRTLATAIIGAALGALAGGTAGMSALLPALIWLAVICTPLLVIDYELHRLPNRLVFLGDLLAIVLLGLAAALRHDWREALRAAEGAGAVFAVLFTLCFISPKSFGYGDVKLGGLLGGYLGWFGWFYVYYGIFAGFVLGAVAGLSLIALRRAGMKTHLPFGPAMIVGALIVLAFDLVPAVAVH